MFIMLTSWYNLWQDIVTHEKILKHSYILGVVWVSNTNSKVGIS